VDEDALEEISLDIQRLAYDVQAFWFGRFGSEETVKLDGG
jgi:hypothetical protein